VEFWLTLPQYRAASDGLKLNPFSAALAAQRPNSVYVEIETMSMNLTLKTWYNYWGQVIRMLQIHESPHSPKSFCTHDFFSFSTFPSKSEILILRSETCFNNSLFSSFSNSFSISRVNLIS
jgi:hypothetical protein